MIQSVKSEKGQVIIEAVLLLIIFTGLWIGISTKIKNQRWMKTLIEDGPWPKLNGMIESGVWETNKQAQHLHPNNLDRSSSKKEP